jgi:hypothetical protein
MPEVYGHHKLGLELMLGRMYDPLLDEDISILALELSGALRLSRRSYLHARLPIAYAGLDGASGTGLGNLGLGLEHRLSTRVTGARITAWSLGAEVSLPTASDGGDAGLAAALNGDFRMPYPGRYYPNTTTARMHVQFRVDAHKVFLQAQAGVNLLVFDGADDSMLLRFGLALGVSLGRTAALIAEITTLSDVLDDSRGEELWHSLDLGVRFNAGAHTRIGLRVYLPLDSYYRDQDIWGVALDITQWL